MPDLFAPDPLDAARLTTFFPDVNEHQIRAFLARFDLTERFPDDDLETARANAFAGGGGTDV
jgi:hypothetical protein